MKGHGHAIVGATAWLAIAPLAATLAHHPLSPEDLAVGFGLATGGSLLPDLDEPHSTVSRAFQPISTGVAYITKHVSGGHRHATHSILFSVLLGILSTLAIVNKPYGIGVLAFILYYIAVKALLPRQSKHYWWLSFLVAGGAAYATMKYVTPGWWIALAVGAGVFFHLVGDSFTVSGVPFLWPYKRPFGLRWFSTNSSREAIFTGVLTLLLLALIWFRLVDPAMHQEHLHQLLQQQLQRR